MEWYGLSTLVHSKGATMRGRIRVLILASPLVLIGGCGSSISKDDFKATLTKKPPGLSAPVATCVTDELFRTLTDTQREHVYAGELAKLTAAEREAVNNAVVLCASGGPAKTSTTTTSQK